MPFFVYGRDSKTGEVAKRLFSEASTEAEARAHGQAHGLDVSSVVPCREEDRPHDPAANVPLPPAEKKSGAIPPEEAAEFRRSLERVTPNVFMTYGLIAANALVFAAMVFSGVSPFTPTTTDLLTWGAEFGPKTMHGEWWRLFTAMFVHIGFLHLAYNMLAFAYAGPLMERMLGNVGFLVLYLVSGLGGSLWSLYLNPMLVHAGASGAIFGVYGALLATVLVQGKTIPRHVSGALLRLSFIFIGYNLIYSFQPGISLAAHIGGLVVGFLCGLALAQPLTDDGTSSRPLRDSAVAIVGVVLLVVAMPRIQAKYPNVDRLQPLFDRFAVLEKTISDFKVKAINANYDDDDRLTLAGRIETDYLTPWRQTSEQLAAVTPVPQVLQFRVESILKYMNLREQGWQTFLEGVRENDAQKLRDAQDTQKLADDREWDLRRL